MELTEENVLTVLEELVPYIEAIIAKANTGGPVQTIRVEQAPLKITTDDKPYQL